MPPVETDPVTEELIEGQQADATLNVADFEARISAVKAGAGLPTGTKPEAKPEEKADAKVPEKVAENPVVEPQTVEALQAQVAGLKKELARRTDKKDEESTSLKADISKLTEQVSLLTKQREAETGKPTHSDAELHDLLIYRKAELASAKKYGSEEEQQAATQQIALIEAEQATRAKAHAEEATKTTEAITKAGQQFEGLYKQALTLHPDMANKDSAHWKACHQTYQRLHTENPELMTKLPEPWKELLAFSITPVKGKAGEQVLADLEGKLEAGLHAGAKSVGGPTTPTNYSTMPPDQLEAVIARVKAGLPAA